MGERERKGRSGNFALTTGEKTGVRANSLTCHTHKLSYVAHKISLFVPRFVQKALDDDRGVWASWVTPTRVGVSVSVYLS